MVVFRRVARAETGQEGAISGHFSAPKSPPNGKNGSNGKFATLWNEWSCGEETMVEAAGIEPSRETDTIATLLAQKAHTNHTPQAACEDLIDTFHPLSGQNRDTFLQLVCAIYVQWNALPPSTKNMVRNWASLPEDAKEHVERMAEQLQVAEELE